MAINIIEYHRMVVIGPCLIIFFIAFSYICSYEMD